MNVALYSRVSTQEQAVNGHSIDEQILRMQNFCAAMKWDVYKVYTDAGFSGANKNRPALQQMKKKKKKIDKVLVYKLDRLSRSQKDTLELIEDVFLKNGVDFVSMSENFDTSTPFGRAMIGVLAVFAQLEREQIKERMLMGKYARAKQGLFYGSSVVPIGYDYIDGSLIANDFEKMQVQMIFDLAEKGKSPPAIAKELNEKGFSHRYGSWRDLSVRRVLTSRIYLGELKFGKKWYSAPHEPLIDQRQFDCVQSIMQDRSERHMKFNSRAGKATSYLGGFLYCGCCGGKYVKNTARKKANGQVYEYEYFYCYSRLKRDSRLVKNPDCKNKVWRVDELTKLVFGEIRKLALDPDYIADVQSDRVEDERPKIISSEIGKIDDQLSRLLDLYTVGHIPLEILQEKIADQKDRKDRLELELQDIEAEKTKKLSVAETQQIVRTFDDVLDRGSLDEVRSVISSLIEKIELNGEAVKIFWKF